jgi:hypothetical protein
MTKTTRRAIAQQDTGKIVAMVCPSRCPAHIALITAPDYPPRRQYDSHYDSRYDSRRPGTFQNSSDSDALLIR